MKITKNHLILITAVALFLMAILALVFHEESVAHLFRKYEIVRGKYEEGRFIVIDNRRVYYATGAFGFRDLWMKERNWDVHDYSPKAIKDMQDAISTATYIKNNWVNAEAYRLQEHDVESIFYDTKYDVWCVGFSPPGWENGPDEFTVGILPYVMFRGYNGDILYIGYA